MRQIGQVLDHFHKFIDRACIRITGRNILSIPCDIIYSMADIRANNIFGLDAIVAGMRIINTNQHNAMVCILIYNDFIKYFWYGDALSLRIVRAQIEWLIHAIDIGVASNSVRASVHINVDISLGHEFLQTCLHLQPITTVER